MRKVLIVEDETALRDAYGTILSSEPYLIDLAENGEEALEKCTKVQYDLILLDLMMPVLDGVGFLRKANLSATSPSTKIVVFSNLSMGNELEQAIAMGISRHLLKSDLSPRQLLAIVRYELSSQ